MKAKTKQTPSPKAKVQNKMKRSVGRPRKIPQENSPIPPKALKAKSAKLKKPSPEKAVGMRVMKKSPEKLVEKAIIKEKKSVGRPRKLAKQPVKLTKTKLKKTTQELAIIRKENAEFLKTKKKMMRIMNLLREGKSNDETKALITNSAKKIEEFESKELTITEEKYFLLYKRLIDASKMGAKLKTAMEENDLPKTRQSSAKISPEISPVKRNARRSKVLQKKKSPRAVKKAGVENGAGNVVKNSVKSLKKGKQLKQ